MKKSLFLIFAVSFFVITAKAQVSPQEQAPYYNNATDGAANKNEDLYIPESLDANVDSLLNSWHVQYYTKRSPECGRSGNVYVPDSVFADRLSRLPRIMEMPYNYEVRSFIDLYVDRRRNLVEYMLGLADFYFPMIEKALDENGLPMELKYLTIVESALNPVALSRAGASGLWQFMLPTGKIYGLEINSLVDERRDPVKSTYAACTYLKDMYNIYGDWNLVIAAYNCGPGNVNKAIRKAGGKTDYWAIYEYLPRETRSYVPLFIAANYVMNYYAEHNLCPVMTELPLSTDTVMINKQLHFNQISEILQIDKDQLKALNPQFKREVVPGNYKPYVLSLPATHAYSFVDKADSIYAYKADEYFANRTSVSPGGRTYEGNSGERVVHRVKTGETLSKIASNYGVTVSQIKRWNGLKSNKVPKGRRLTLYVDNGGYDLASNSSSSTQKKTEKQDVQKTTAESNAVADNKVKESTASKDVTVKKTQEKVTASAVTQKTYKNYKVRQGDSFYSISQKYPGFSAKDLMKLNNMTSSSLRVGQVIKVPVG